MFRHAIAFALILLAFPAAAQTAKSLFGRERIPSAQTPAPIGAYSRGCLAGGMVLAESGPRWQAMRLSRNRNWGHPAAISFISRLSEDAARQPGWSGLYIGDISQPRGGPMTSGHASHQIGLDIDIWMLPATNLRLSKSQRESVSSITLARSDGAYINGNWTRAHEEIIKAAAKDPAVARIFLFPGGKVQLCKTAGNDRGWLRKVRPWWGHDTHFHVRLSCPRGASGCANQDPPPPGDGCAEAEQWVRNILNPPPPDPNAPPARGRRDLTLADLPQACASVISR